MNPLLQLKKAIPTFVITILIVCLSLLPKAQAISPPPDGGYPNYTTAEGTNALLHLTTGIGNTAIGALSLISDTVGSYNVAVGAGALALNTASNNTAVGAAALLLNTTGVNNTANGLDALAFNTTGGENTANGLEALYNNTFGFNNTAIGSIALSSNTTGNNNTALGASAGSLVTMANNVTCIGAGVGGEDVSSTTWIANVYGITTQNGTTAPVIVSADGQLGTVASSERFKKDITTMEKSSEAILALRPVTFHYKSDTKNTPQFGLIAEEVAKVDPALVLPDKEGKPYTVRYDQVNAMLLNKFLKEHRKVEKLEASAAQQQKQIEALAAGLQKVSAQVEASKPAPQVVDNP